MQVPRARSPIVLPLLLGLLVPFGAGGCVAAPTPGDGGVTAGVHRVLALDFGSRATARREGSAQRVLAAFSAEPRRVERLRSAAGTAGDELQRATRIGERTAELSLAELQRRPRTPNGLVPPPSAVAQELADDLHLLLTAWWPSRPLGEVDDRQHRTDPHDDRPEATLWQRLSRRLQL